MFDTFGLDGLFYVCNITVPVDYSAAGVIYLLKVYVYNLLPSYEIHFWVNFLECIHFYIFTICMKLSLLHAISDVFFAYST
jgi:hypothetical protein